MADFLAANPLPRTIEPPSTAAPDGPTTPSVWESTPRPDGFLWKVDALAASFPRVQEDLLLIALTLNSKSLTEASSWLEKETSRKADILALKDAFPGANDDALSAALQAHGRSFTSAYWSLSGKFTSTWGHASIAP